MVPTGRLDYFDRRMRLDEEGEWHFGSEGIAVVDGRVQPCAAVWHASAYLDSKIVI